MKQTVYRLSIEKKQRVLERLASVIGQKNDILFAYTYGSFAEDLPFHDIDVGVYLANGEPASALHFALELAARLEQDVHFPVDVRILNFAPVLFLYHVFLGLVIFDRNDDFRADLAERTVQRYLDIKPFITRGIREAFTT